MLIDFENVTFGYVGVPVVEDVSFTLHEKERVGFVGANGEGKTTLVRLALGLLTPDFGNITRRAGITVGYLEQTGGFESELTVYAAMEEVFAEDKRLLVRLRETEKEMETAGENEMRVLSARYESLNKQIAARDSYHYDVRIKTVLNGMGFTDVYGQVVSTMSGGEKTRLKLCRLLLEEPDLLVLDEPTNHLDIATLFWLEEYLQNFKGALFVISHDRYFLDRLTSRTLELDRKRLYSYRGNYTAYKALKEERLLREKREYEKQQEEIEKLETYIAKNIVRATTAKSAQSRVKQLDKIEPLSRPLPPVPPPRFEFPYDEEPYERVMTTDKFDLTVGGKVLLRDIDFTLMRGERCALVGENGTGKSTLLRFFLSGDKRVRFGRNTKISYYDQENADLDPEARVLDAFWEKHVLMQQTDVRKRLARAGLTEEDVFKKIGELSGGQRARLELSILEAKRGNVLFLDEPTNHLDLGAREALEDALKKFEGTLLFVSHDRRFLEAIATRIAVLEKGSLTLFNGGYDDYLKEKDRGMSEKKPAEPPAEKKKTDSYRSREDRSREERKKTRIKEIETKIAALEEEEHTLNAELIRLAADYREVARISARLNEIQQETAALYEEYETLI